MNLLGFRVLASTKKGLSLGTLIEHTLIDSHKPFCTYPSTSNTLIQRLIKEPSSRIRAILESEQNLTLKSFDFSWLALVSSLNSSSASKAREALEWRLEKLQKNNERNEDKYSELIFLCGETRNLQLAMYVFMTMESMGVKLTLDTFNSLILVFQSSRNEMTALSLFEIMVRSKDYKPNSVTYNSFISMYSKMGNINSMEAWASAKKDAGFSADLFTYESLISAYIKSKSFDFADKYYEEMLSLGIIPNMCILEKMVEGLCLQQDFARAKEFTLRILENGWKISVHIATMLSGLYSKFGKLEEMEEFLQTLTLSNQDKEVLSRVHCGIIGMHARADRLDDMEYSIGKMLKQGIPFKSAEDIKFVICSYSRRAAYDRLEVFLEHVKVSYKFTKPTFDLLVNGYREAGLSERLDILLKDMSFCEI